MIGNINFITQFHQQQNASPVSASSGEKRQLLHAVASLGGERPRNEKCGQVQLTGSQPRGFQALLLEAQTIVNFA